MMMMMMITVIREIRTICLLVSCQICSSDILFKNLYHDQNSRVLFEMFVDDVFSVGNFMYCSSELLSLKCDDRVSGKRVTGTPYSDNKMVCR